MSGLISDENFLMSNFSQTTVFSQVVVLKVARAALAVACLLGFSDVHECSGIPQMAPSPLDKQTAGCDSPHDWLMSLAMDLGTLCDI